MKQRAAKKHLPSWIPVVVIAVVVVIVAVVAFLQFGVRKQVKFTKERRASIQKYIESGGVTMVGREVLEKAGIKFPPDYEERVKRRQAELAAKRAKRSGAGAVQ